MKLKDLPQHITILAIVLSLLLPGYGFLYVTNQDVLIHFESIQLILALILYSLPTFLLWTIEAIISYGKEKELLFLIQVASIKTLFYSCFFFIILYQFSCIFPYKAEYLFYGSTILLVLLDIIDSKFIFKK